MLPIGQLRLVTTNSTNYSLYPLPPGWPISSLDQFPITDQWSSLDQLLIRFCSSRTSFCNCVFCAVLLQCSTTWINLMLSVMWLSPASSYTCCLIAWGALCTCCKITAALVQEEHVEAGGWGWTTSRTNVTSYLITGPLKKNKGKNRQPEMNCPLAESKVIYSAITCWGMGLICTASLPC